MNDYDVAVVGAGPVGSSFARQMAQKGFKVGLIERKKEVGVPLQCAGLVGKKIMDTNILPEEFIVNKVYGAYLYSPSGTVLSVSKREPAAYVLDRVAYDKFLAEKAVEAGADLLLNHRVNGLDIENGEIHIKDHGKISADVIVGADGQGSFVSSQMNPPSKSVQAAQYLVDTGSSVFNSDYVQLHVNSDISPGFIWVIPISESRARVGLFADTSYQNLNQILKNFISNDKQFEGASVVKKYQGFIPQYDPKKKIVQGRTILLGDAASQVKPTTGGGLIIGFKCANMAADVVSKALDEGDMKLLQDYPKNYMGEYKKELRMQLEVQKIFGAMTDEELDRMFMKLKKGGAESMISEYGDMDTQSTLIKEMLKSGLLLSILPGMILKGLLNIWK